MSGENWTPGPYCREGRFVYALNEGGTNRFQANVDQGWERGTEHRDERTSYDECEATATLFQAAPDLYSALKHAKCPDCDGSGISTYIGNEGVAEQEPCGWCEQRREAMAKARGETP